MAGRGPAPKPANMQQKRGKNSSRQRTLTKPSGKVPELPNPDGREWHPMTLEWWRVVWSSPMANEYLDADRYGLARVATLVDEYYSEWEYDGDKLKEVRLKQGLLAEIRLQEARFGLSPVDRARLQWVVDQGEEAGQRRQKRKSPSASKPKGRRKTPADVLESDKVTRFTPAKEKSG